MITKLAPVNYELRTLVTNVQFPLLTSIINRSFMSEVFKLIAVQALIGSASITVPITFLPHGICL